jgi:hypothetical protein
MCAIASMFRTLIMALCSNDVYDLNIYCGPAVELIIIFPAGLIVVPNIGMNVGCIEPMHVAIRPMVRLVLL